MIFIFQKVEIPLQPPQKFPNILLSFSFLEQTKTLGQHANQRMFPTLYNKYSQKQKKKQYQINIQTDLIQMIAFPYRGGGYAGHPFPQATHHGDKAVVLSAVVRRVVEGKG
jgi:hypothetical protein